MNVHTAALMAVSGTMGGICFAIVNFIPKARKLTWVAIIQVSLNLFVNRTWWAGYLLLHGDARSLAFIGATVPCIMGTITTGRVIYPAIKRRLRIWKGAIFMAR